LENEDYAGNPAITMWGGWKPNGGKEEGKPIKGAQIGRGRNSSACFADEFPGEIV